jgi:hypothetical protein
MGLITIALVASAAWVVVLGITFALGSVASRADAETERFYTALR